jgi:hypothetical protein
MNKIDYLKESFGYKGSFFEENYLGSMFLKAFVNDALVFGPKETKKLYEEIFGQDVKPILEAMTSDGLCLLEASRIGTSLLFEDFGRKKVETYISFSSSEKEKLEKLGYEEEENFYSKYIKRYRIKLYKISDSAYKMVISSDNGEVKEYFRNIYELLFHLKRQERLLRNN